MKKNIIEITGACFTAILVAFILSAALGVHADTRGSLRGDVSDVRGTSSAPAQEPVPAPDPIPSVPTASSGGGINNSTTGNADSGGNEGGDVETGEENVDIHVVNEGPTNSNTVVTITSEDEEEEVVQPTPSEPEPTCDARSRECTDGGRGR